MTLVAPCLDNIFVVLLMSELAKIGAMEPALRGRGFMHAWAWFVIIVQILNSSKNSIFFVSDIDLCRAMLPNYLRAYYSAL